MLSNKTISPIVTELFIRRRSLVISLAFNTESYFALPKNYWSIFYTLFYYENSK